MRTTATSSEMLGAMIDGYNAARSQFPGHRFVGAFGEADKAGYPSDPWHGPDILRRCFVTLFLDNIPRRIVTNREGVIVR